MELGNKEKNRQYVDDTLTRLEHATDDRCLFLEKKEYCVGDPIVLIVFLAHDEADEAFAAMDITEVIQRIRDNDFEGINGLSLGLVGGHITQIKERVIYACGWKELSEESRYTLTLDNVDCFHDYDDLRLYGWRAMTESGNKILLTELDYALLSVIKHYDLLNQFLSNIIEGLTQICDYDEKEETELIKKLYQIQQNTKQQKSTTVH